METMENGETRPARRAVLITGAPARRNARDEYATVELTTRDPADCAREIEGCLQDYKSADPTFLEIRQEGSGGHKAIRRLDPVADAPAPAADANMNSMMGALVNGITAANSTLTTRVNHLEGAILHQVDERLKLAERCATSETLFLIEQEKNKFLLEHGSGDDEAMRNAMTLLTPLLTPVGTLLGAKAAEMAAAASKGAKDKAAKDKAAKDKAASEKAAGEKSAGKGAEDGPATDKAAGPGAATKPAETLDEQADRVIGEAIALADNHPELLKPRAAQLVVLGLKIQTVLKAA